MFVSIQKNITYALLAVSLLPLAGCAGFSSSETVREQTAVMPVTDEKEGVVFDVLSGEFAGTRGSLVDAANYYMRAARQNRGAEIADRAAHIALYAKHYKDALEAVDIWRQAGQPGMEAQRIAAVANLKLGRMDAASQAFDAYLFVDGKLNSQSMNAFAVILSHHKDDAGILKMLSQLDAKHPGQALLLLQLGRYQARMQQHEKALATAAQILKLEPDASAAYLLKAQVYSAQNKTAKALSAVAAALDKRPNDNRLRLQYARMLVQLKKYDDAWEEFMQLRLNKPDDSGVLLSLALLSVETNKQLLAKEYFKELIEKKQHLSQAHYYLGRIDQSDKLFEEAQQHYLLVKSGEFVLDAKVRRAGLLAETGQPEAALKILQQLLANGDLEPNIKSRLYLAQGEILRQAKRMQDAMNVYTQALQKMPDNSDILYARALTAEKLNQLDITEADLLKVLQHEPENANALNALGFTLADRNKRLQEAKNYILKAAELLPNDPAVLDSLGWLHYRLGEYDEAIKWLKKAFSHYKDAEIAAHLGEVLWENGQNKKAQQVWQQGLELNAENLVLQKTLKRYQQ